MGGVKARGQGSKVAVDVKVKVQRQCGKGDDSVRAGESGLVGCFLEYGENLAPAMRGVKRGGTAQYSNRATRFGGDPSKSLLQKCKIFSKAARRQKVQFKRIRPACRPYFALPSSPPASSEFSNCPPLPRFLTNFQNIPSPPTSPLPHLPCAPPSHRAAFPSPSCTLPLPPTFPFVYSHSYPPPPPYPPLPPPAMKSNYGQPSSSRATSIHPISTAGKRTYADAALSPAKPVDSSLPLSLQLGKRRRRRSTATYASLARRLQRRELGLSSGFSGAALARDKFTHVRLQVSFDIHCKPADDDPRLWTRHPNRSRIIEIVSSRDLIFALANNGVCTVFSRDLREKVCLVNTCKDEVIRSLFLNKINDSLITVSVFKKDEFSSLHCRSTPLAHLRKGKIESGYPIFETECLRWPGFVEFDDVNGKILTFSADDKTYKVWDLRTYEHSFTIPYKGITEIKISPGIMLLVFERMESYVPIRILNVTNGQLLRDIKHMLHRKRKLEFIEQFHQKLLVKQENENLQIVDVCTGDHVVVDRSHFLLPNAFIFLYESELFLTFQNRQVSVWNFCGERVTVFEDHTLFSQDSSTNCIYITQKQDIIVSHCQQEGECGHGSINMSWIDSGKSLGKITCGPNHAIDHIRALENVSALHYNEERNEIYSGTRDGVVHVWSN